MERDPVLAYIGLGANLGDAAQAVRDAAQAIAALEGIDQTRCSPLYRSAPLDSSGGDYINAVLEVYTGMPAPLLLSLLQKIEQSAGRERPYRNAPRTLDLDLLLYGSARIESAALTVPHPRMGQRAFVLRPLADLAPHLVTRGALDAVREQRIERVACVERGP